MFLNLEYFSVGLLTKLIMVLQLVIGLVLIHFNGMIKNVCRMKMKDYINLKTNVESLDNLLITLNKCEKYGLITNIQNDNNRQVKCQSIKLCKCNKQYNCHSVFVILISTNIREIVIYMNMANFQILITKL